MDIKLFKLLLLIVIAVEYCVIQLKKQHFHLVLQYEFLKQ